MGACKSAESENNVRQMTDLLLNPPPPPFKPRAANDLDLNISYLLAHPTPSLPD